MNLPALLFGLVFWSALILWLLGQIRWARFWRICFVAFVVTVAIAGAMHTLPFQPH